MGVLFAVMTAAFWALYNLAVHRGRELMDPGAGYLLTILINVVANLAFTLLPLPGAGAAGFGGLPVLYFVLGGCFTTLVGRWFYYETVYTLGPSRASVWKNMAPVYTLVLAALFLREALTPIPVLGVAAALLGAWLLSREQEKGEEMALAPHPGAGVRRSQRLGILLGLGSGLAFSGGYLVRRAGLLIWPDAAWGNAIGAISALVGWLPFALAFGEFGRLWRARGPGLGYWIAAGLLSSLAQLCAFLSLRVLPSAVAQVITSLEPVFTMGFSLLLLGHRENLNRRLILAVAVVCAGVTLVAL